MTRKYQLPPGVRFLTDDELAARRAAKLEQGAKGQARAAAKEIGRGFSLALPKVRRSRRRKRFRPPASIFGLGLGKPGRR